jgi:pimeloyl-ACP methyl ester carboxylesterase
MWDLQAHTLPNSIRFIAPDMRGHGASDIGDGHYTIEFFVDDVIALLDHLVIQKAIFCGLSMGGYIALRAVERHPDRCKGLILCDTRSEADTNEAKLKRSASIKMIQNEGVAVFAENFVKAIFAPKTFEINPWAVEKIASIIKRNSPTGIIGTLLALAARTDTTESLSKIDIPTLVLCGELDQLTPPSASKSLHEQIKGSVLYFIHDAAHMSNIENPEIFNSKLLSFLSKLK